ncbi:uncharacterized protein [Arachis hypogaea]|uniref:uncharacterized protein n=1 Tax=Arachis hypogaea TaxID=3818 RepID=UPI003B224DEB
MEAVRSSCENRPQENRAKTGEPAENRPPSEKHQPSRPPASPRSQVVSAAAVAWFPSTSSPPAPPSSSLFSFSTKKPSHRLHRRVILNTGSRPSNPVMDNVVNQEAIADNNASVNNAANSNDAANPNPPSANDSQSQGSSNLRGKTDLAWKYVALQMVNGKPQYQCLFCLQVFNGGGIHRMKKHLAKITGDVKKCPKVPYDVEKQMESLLKEIQTNKNKRKVSFSEEGGDEVEDAIDEAIAQEEQQRTSSQQVVGGDPKKKAKVIPAMFAPRTTPGAQPSIRSVLQNKEAIHEVDKRFARWMMDCKIPFNAVMSPFFQDMLDGVAGIGPGYKGPSYDKLRVHLLADLKREGQMVVDSYRSAWKETGCTLMADGWTDQRQRTLINFLVYCSKGLCFVKSIDASSIVKNAQHLCNLFSEVIEWIGPNNIVHVVTDNAANYVAAGRLINRNYDNIYWSPCAAHCLNLILKDISSMAHISNLATRASKITVFVYNHTVFLSWLRKKPHWREIVRPGPTRFATVFITLMSIFERKKDLQALVVDSIFTDHKLGRSATGRAVSATILDCKFWDDCFTVCKLVGPLIKLLRLVDGDDKPSLGYVYEGMQRAEDAIKEMFRQNKTAYQPYTDIINSRWDKHLKKHLHAAAYFLNPSFFFNENFKEEPDVMRVDAMKEIQLYRDRKESFDRPEAIRAASQLKPDEWWRLFGSSAPCLQKIAVRILSQASASSGCERNWSLFDQIHTKRRNRLEHDRLNDIVYVTYNLRLKSSLVDFWVTEEVVEKEPDLPSNVDDLLREIDADLYQSGGGSGGLYAASVDSSAEEGGNEGEDVPTEADLQQVFADFDD